jgi:hypothetical protein
MHTRRSHYFAIGAVLAGCVGGYLFWAHRTSTAATAAYDPAINPADFVHDIDNKYFTLRPGTKFTYQDKRGFE